MRKVAVLVDGDFYLRRHRNIFGQQSDAKTVAKELVDHCLKHISRRGGSERLYRIFFYDCAPLEKKIHNPLTGKMKHLGKTEIAQFRNSLHSQLKQTRNLALRLGHLDEKNARWKIKDPEKEKNYIFGELKSLEEEDIAYYASQKGVDMKIGLDIASLAYKKLVDKIVLISGDSDFVPAAKLARVEGIEFILDAMRADIKPNLQEHIDGLNTTLPKPKKSD